jgi:hypothetical protein
MRFGDRNVGFLQGVTNSAHEQLRLSTLANKAEVNSFAGEVVILEAFPWKVGKRRGQHRDRSCSPGGSGGLGRGGHEAEE